MTRNDLRRQRHLLDGRRWITFAIALVGGLALVGFGLVAWWPTWPIDFPPYDVIDGIVIVGLGVCAIEVVAIPGILATYASRTNRRWAFLAVPLVLITLYVAYFWMVLTYYFRDPDVAFLW